MDSSSGLGPDDLALMHSWRRRLWDCVGLDATAKAPLDPPHVAFVDGSYHAGGHLLNIPSLLHGTKAGLHGAVDVAVHHLEVQPHFRLPCIHLRCRVSPRIVNAATALLWLLSCSHVFT